MKVGILETGAPRPHLVPRFGRYDAMVARLLGPGYDIATYDVTAGAFPCDVKACDAYVITGSAAGVYDPLPWIGELKDFLHRADGQAKLVGICFGHQIMAEAFGGRVAKSEKGWGLGLHSYAVQHKAGWMDSAASAAIPVSHQDQVIVKPPQAEVLGGSDFTPNGILSYGRGAISFQFHPEFDNDYAEVLVEMRRDILDPHLAEKAIASLQKPSDSPRVGGWIRQFLAER